MNLQVRNRFRQKAAGCWKGRCIPVLLSSEGGVFPRSYSLVTDRKLSDTESVMLRNGRLSVGRI